MRSSSFSPLNWLLGFAGRLRFPTLFLLTASVFILDLLIPDVIPFADEIFLGLVTALIGSIRRKESALPPDNEKEDGLHKVEKKKKNRSRDIPD